MHLKPPAGHFTILYFASAATFTRKASDTFAAPLPASKLFDVLDQHYPGMRKRVLESCAVTINLDYIDLDSTSQEDGENSTLTIEEGDEVGIIPPVSSG